MLGHFLGTCPARWPFFGMIWCILSLMRSADPGLRFLRIANARWQWRSALSPEGVDVPASHVRRTWSCCPFPSSRDSPTGTASPARLLRISPRLLPSHPLTTSVDRHAQAYPHSSSRSFPLVRMTLHRETLPHTSCSERFSFSWTTIRLHVSSNGSVVPICSAE
jgi:hypothetical protein